MEVQAKQPEASLGISWAQNKGAGPANMPGQGSSQSQRSGGVRHAAVRQGFKGPQEDPVVRGRQKQFTWSGLSSSVMTPW